MGDLSGDTSSFTYEGPPDSYSDYHSLERPLTAKPYPHPPRGYVDAYDLDDFNHGRESQTKDNNNGGNGKANANGNGNGNQRFYSSGLVGSYSPPTHNHSPPFGATPLPPSFPRPRPSHPPDDWNDSLFKPHYNTHTHTTTLLDSDPRSSYTGSLLSSRPRSMSENGEGGSNNGRANKNRFRADGSEMTLMEMLLDQEGEDEDEDDDDDKDDNDLPLRAHAGLSRSSLASSLSLPPSAASYIDRSSIYSYKPLLSNKPSTLSQTLAQSNQQEGPVLHQHPQNPSVLRQSESSNTWSDPFRDPDLRPLRRRSTVSGYSVSSTDLVNLRRGSLASTDNPSVASRAGSIVSRSELQEPADSLSWEQWAAAYRDSLSPPISYTHTRPPHAQASQSYRTVQPRRSPAGSMSSEVGPLASPHDTGTGNLFYHLQRQFVARPGSRSESNRILIIELCHALEEYSSALATLWQSLPLQTNPSSSIHAEPIRLPPATAQQHPPVSSQLTQIEHLANEVDSLVREIIEAVPAFSYSLSQGNYGPLPFTFNNLSSIKAIKELNARAYLEEVQVIPRIKGEVEYDGSVIDCSWPVRLKEDLRDGLLHSKTHQDSPHVALHALELGPSGHRSTPDPTMARSSTSMGTERSDVLLEEGRKRWQEYKQARP